MFGISTAYGQSAAAPAHVYAVESGNTTAVVLWDPSAQAVSYNIYRNGTQVATRQHGTVYNDSGLTAGFGYGYTITAVDSHNHESAQSAAAITATSMSGISACPGTGPSRMKPPTPPIPSIRAALPAWLADTEKDESAIAAGHYRSVNTIAARGAINFIDMANQMLLSVFPYTYCQSALFTDENPAITKSMLQNIHDAAQDAYAHLIAGTDTYAGKLSGYIAIKGFDGWNDWYYYTLPASYNPSRPYKLDIHLHWATSCSIPIEGTSEGYGTRAPGRPLLIAAPSTISNTNSTDTIYVDPCDRNVYAGPAQQSLLDTIADIESHFNIDKAQITIHGESMGATGSANISAVHPDMFKGVGLFTGGTGYQMPGYRHVNGIVPSGPGDPRYDAQNLWQNMAHTPVVIWGASDSSPSSHGGAFNVQGSPAPTPSCTTSVPSIPNGDSSWTEAYFPNECRDKLTFDRFQTAHAGLYSHMLALETDGHARHGKIDPATQRRGYRFLYSTPPAPRYPSFVSYLTPVEKYDGAYWVHGLRRAQVETGSVPKTGSIQVSASGSAITVTTNNLAGFNLDLSAANALFSRQPSVTVTIDGDNPLHVPTGSVQWFKKSGSIWSIGSAPSLFVKRAGVSGPLLDIFSRPTIFVYGTRKGNTPVMGQALTESILSGFLKERGVPNPILQYGSYITKADTALMSSDIRNYNLVLIGTPAQNSVIHRIMSTYPNNVPFRFHKNGSAYDGVVINRITYNDPHSGWSILSPDPLNPSHYVLFASENYNSGSQLDTNGVPTKFGGMLSDWIIMGLVSGNQQTLHSGTFPANWNLPSPINPRSQ